MNLKQVLQNAIPGWQGKLMGHSVSYLADGHVHRGVPYVMTDSKVIAKKLALMQAAGFDGVISTWQGPLAKSSHAVAGAMAAQCGEIGMLFALLLDPWCAKLGIQGNPTQNVTNALNDAETQAMLNGTSYVPEHYVLDFNTGASLPALASSFPHLTFLQQSTGFSWPMIPWNPSGYASMNKLPSMKMPGVCFQFNDAGMPLPAGVQSMAAFLQTGGKRDYSQSVWGGPARILDGQGGAFFFSQLPTIQAGSPYICVVTIDDYDEQTAIEPWLAGFLGCNWSDNVPFTPPTNGTTSVKLLGVFNGMLTGTAFSGSLNGTTIKENS